MAVPCPMAAARAAGVIECWWGSSNVVSAGRHRASLAGLRRVFACPRGALGAPPVARVARLVWVRGRRFARSSELSSRAVGAAGGCPGELPRAVVRSV